MKRLTTNCPDNNLDAALNLFYIKDFETWVRGGGDGPDYPDIRLYDFIRKAAKILLPDLDFPTDDDGVDYAMGEVLMASDYEEKYTEQEWISVLQDRLAAYEDRECAPEEVLPKDKADEIALKLMRLADLESLCSYTRLRELAEADKDGRLVVLPCKVGDTVYFALLGRIIEKQVFSIVSFSNSTRIYCGGTSEYFRPEDIGKTFFLTREEAENALGAMKDG